MRTSSPANTYRFVVFDADKSLTGTSTWDVERGIVFGTYAWDHQSPKRWQRRWWVENDRNCTQSEDKAPECQTIYADGNPFYEVNADGEVNAISVPVR